MPDDNVGLDNNQGSSDEGGSNNSEGQETQLTIDKWREAISEEYATHSSLSDIKDLNGLAKSYIHAQKMVGADKTATPKDDWTDDDWNVFYEKIGRPESFDKYNIDVAEDIPEGMSFNDDYMDSFKQEAHKNGLSVKQANQLWKFLEGNSIEGFNNAINAKKQTNQEGWDNLKKEWGNAYNQNIKLAEKVAVIGGPEFMDWAKKSGILQESKMIEFAAKIGKHLSEDSIGKEDFKSSPILSPREALSKINKIMGTAEHAYHDDNNPAHKDAVKEVRGLYKQAYPDEE